MDTTKVTVTDVDIRFWTMVILMVKWAFAVIPALAIIAFFSAAIAVVCGGGFALLSGLVK